jgi:hypothetical protein
MARCGVWIKGVRTEAACVRPQHVCGSLRTCRARLIRCLVLSRRSGVHTGDREAV